MWLFEFNCIGTANLQRKIKNLIRVGNQSVPKQKADRPTPQLCPTFTQLQETTILRANPTNTTQLWNF